MTKNLKCKLERTERVYGKITDEISSLNEKIRTCAEENAKTELELDDVTKTVNFCKSFY